MKQTISFLLCFILFTYPTNNIIQIPPISNDETVQLRINQLKSLDSSFKYFGNLTTIFKKEVYEVINGQEVAFSPCSEEPPETKFYALASSKLADKSVNENVIYDFEKIKYSHSLIDLIDSNGKIFSMMSNGKAQIYQISSKFDSIGSPIQIQTGETKIRNGEFVILSNHSTFSTSASKGREVVLFINQNQAYSIDTLSLKYNQIKDFKTLPAFEAAITLQGKYVAVALGPQGIKLYSYNFQNDSLKEEYQIEKGNNTSNFIDLAYDSNRKILFALDRNFGVIPYHFSQASASLQTTSSVISNRNCNLIFYNKLTDDLHLSCRELYKYELTNWPVVKRKILPKSDITVRHIVATSKLLGFIGRDVFQIVYAQRKTATYENVKLDKLILKQKYFISANQYSILIGQYSINPSSLVCTTDNQTLAGFHRLVLRMTAQCSDTNRIKNGDKCIYTVYQNLQIWKPAQFKTTHFIVGIILIMITALSLIVYMIVTSLKIKRLTSDLNQYQNLQEQGSGKDKNIQFSQQIEPNKLSDIDIKSQQNPRDINEKQDKNQENVKKQPSKLIQMSQDINEIDAGLHDIE